MKLVYTLLLSSIFIISYSTQASEKSASSLVGEGAKLYSENCGRCHNPVPATSYSKKEWSVIMPHMREKAHLTGKETLAIEAFLASTLTSDVKQPSKTEASVTPVVRSGEELVAQFGCQGCHVIKGEGGALGPSLDGVVQSKGLEFVLKKLKDPKFNNQASAMPRYPMADEQMKAIADYLDKK